MPNYTNSMSLNMNLVLKVIHLHYKCKLKTKYTCDIMNITNLRSLIVHAWGAPSHISASTRLDHRTFHIGDLKVIALMHIHLYI